MKLKSTAILIALLLVAGLNSFGQNQYFLPVAGGPSGVSCSLIHNGELYVGGSFTTAGGTTANRIAKWNGSSWSTLGTGLDGTVNSMAIHNGDLYVGGDFIMAGGVTCNHIAKWDGIVWSSLGVGVASGSFPPTTVYTVETYLGDLYVGGSFGYAGGVAVSNFAKWDGVNWTSLGTATAGPKVTSSLVFNNELYVLIDQGNSGKISKWNGTVWTNVFSSATWNTFRHLAVYNNEIYYDNKYQLNGGGNPSTYNIKSLSGSTLPTMNSFVSDMKVINGELYVGGDFTLAGMASVNHIAKLNWSGFFDWSAVGNGIGSAINNLIVYNNVLYAATFSGFYWLRVPAIEPTAISTNININNITTNSLSITWTSGNGSKHLVVAKSGSAVNQVPTDTMTYNPNSAFGTGSDLGAGNYVVYGGTGNSVTVTNLSPDTIYHFAIYEYNDSTITGYENYLTTSFATASHTTIASEPTVATGNFSFSNVTLTDMTVTVAPGNGSHRIIITKQNSFVNNTALVDTMAYTANSVFGSGTAQGTGNYIVYNGTGTTFNLSGLTPNTPYYFASYEYNGTTPAANNYLLASPGTGMQGSLNSEPTIQPSVITFTNITDNSMTLSWTNGDGINRIVIARTSTVNAAPEDGVEYTANSVFASGDDLGLNNYVVYSGTSNTFNLTGLTANTTYYFAIYEYNGTNTSNNYLMPAPATAFKSTLFLEPATPASNLTLSPITNGITTVSWTNGSGSNRVVVVREGLPLNELPDDGNGYTANSTFTSGTDLGSANYICFNGNTNSFNLQGLNPANVYYVGVIEYNGSGTSANYLTSSFPIANNLPASPTIAASALSITANSNSSALVSWTNGDGQYRLLIVKANSAVDETPLDGSIYSANASFSSGAQLGTGNYTVYNGTANNTIVTNLDSNITYYFALFEFNKDGAGPANYLEAPSLTGNYNLITGVGIDEITEQFSATVYPNPTSGILHIKHQNMQQMNVTVYNMLGEKVLQQQNATEINLSDTPKGIYFVRIYDNSKSYITKISVK